MNAQRTPTIVPRMLSVPTHLARSTARATVVTMEMDVPVQVRCLAGPSCSSFSRLCSPESSIEGFTIYFVANTKSLTRTLIIFNGD